MKLTIILLIFLFLTACNQRTGDIKKLQSKIDSLQKELAEIYKPGFGELMSGVQTHHAKLWFAGINENWPLADFEVHEIKESLEDVQKYCSDRPETKAISMMNPAIDSITNAITEKNTVLFRNNFLLLTNTCNNCHKETGQGFNIVTIPSAPPVVNQDFKPAK
ncbi:MAG TPA: hypothetical protein VN451_08385 [Chitinophagaceae bacterium]|nr:hypothetical protein [Chitinophagaceae bacterium]